MSPDNPIHQIAQSLAEIRQRMKAAASDGGRPAAEIELVAVSKRQPEPRINAALQAGHRVFGENRVQDARTRWAARRAEYPDLSLHLIGALQTNKAEDAVALFDVIEVVDRPKLVRALAAAAAKTGRSPDCYIQVNTGEEPQKSGVAPGELDALLDIARAESGLRIIGLMCLPPADEPAGPHFALLADLARARGLERLSMGMSGDYESAIRFGATSVRVGRALFGEREA